MTRHPLAPLGALALAAASFVAILAGFRFGIESLFVLGAVTMPIAVVLGGIFVVSGIVRTLRKRS